MAEETRGLKTRASQTELALPALADRAPLGLLAVAMFLAPLIGGTVSVDTLSLEPGYTPLMKAIFGGSELPLLSHFVLALLVCGSAAWVLVSRRVIQVPMPYVSMLWIGFFGFVGASVVFSAFSFVSWPAALEWAVYGIAAFAAVAVSGRRIGPLVLLGSLYAGTLLLALIGIVEHRSSSDPNWRIFGTWQNPNALAAMLLVGFFVGLGLTFASCKGRAAAFGIGSVLIGYALALTQSKGAFVAAACGLLALVALALIWGPGVRRGLRAVLAAGLCLVGIIGLLFVMRPSSGAESGPSAPLSRITDAASTQEQSAGFRVLLWRSAAKLMEQRPLGWGIGSYRFESARPGLTTQTHFAHNSFLQIGAEAGFPALALLVAALAVWSAYFFKGSRGLRDPATIGLRVGLFCACLALLAHSMVDSDLHFFGAGLAFFVLLGIGLQISADGSTPEAVQPTQRWSSFAASLIIPVALFYFGCVEATKAHVRDNLQRGNIEQAEGGILALRSWASADGESWYLAALAPSGANHMMDWLRMACERAPSTRNLRALARQLNGNKRTHEAVAALLRALERDPYNLPTLFMLMNTWKDAQNPSEAETIASRIVEVEARPVYQVRALPDLVPTETFYARDYLSRTVPSPQEKIQLLRPAFDGLLLYAARTVPNIRTAAEAGMPGYAGETPEEAMGHMRFGQQVAKDLLKLYRSGGDESEVRKVESGAGAFDEAIASLDAAVATGAR